MTKEWLNQLKSTFLATWQKIGLQICDVDVFRSLKIRSNEYKLFSLKLSLTRFGV